MQGRRAGEQSEKGYLLLVYKLCSACEEARAGRHDVERALLQARVWQRRGHWRRCRRTHRLCPQHMTWSADCDARGQSLPAVRPHVCSREAIRPLSRP